MKVENLKQKFFVIAVLLIISAGLVHASVQDKGRVESLKAIAEKKVTKVNIEQAAANKEKSAVEYKTEDVTFVADCDGTEQKYVIMVPDTNNLDTQVHDLLIVLHGHGADRWQFVKGSWGQIRAFRDVAMEHEMIFVSPDYRATTSWMGPRAEQDVLQIITTLKKKYRIGKVFIGGGSMGGSSCLTFTAIHPELIDGVCSFNGSANHLEYQNFQGAISASFGGTKVEIPLEYKNRSAEYWPERLTMPIGITLGGKDRSVPPDSMRRLAGVLEILGRDVLVIDRAGMGHSTNYVDGRAVLEFVIEKAAGAE